MILILGNDQGCSGHWGPGCLASPISNPDLYHRCLYNIRLLRNAWKRLTQHDETQTPLR